MNLTVYETVSISMRQVMAIKAAGEAAFLADYPFWTVERRAEDPFGVV